MKQPAKTLIVIAAAIIAVFAIASLFSQGATIFSASAPKDLGITAFKNAIDKKEIKNVNWQGDELSGSFVQGDAYTVHAFAASTASGNDLQKYISDHNVSLTIDRRPVSDSILSWVSMLALPVLMLLALYLFILRPAQMGGNQAMSFGKSRARRAGENTPKVTFAEVAGIEEAKQELFEIVDFLKNTKKYSALGAKIPKGILLTGPPGVGKTYLARAIAGEAGVPFFHLSGSDFVEMFVGVGAARVRDLFETAKAHRPSLIFVDEIDAVGRQRGAGLGGGHDEREQTLNQLLVEMDGFDPNSGVILIAATNRPDVLDPALLRPGRFDRQIVVDAPDAVGREAILKIHSKGKPLGSDINLETIARRTPGFTGADLANALNEAALLAARHGKTKVEQADLEEALDRVIAGPQRKSRVVQERERELIAYHEAGHAIIGHLLPTTDPVHKVTILPRGMSLGSTWSLPTDDKFLTSEHELLDDITMSLGGRVAEELVFNEIYTGAVGDLDRVTRVARAMVCEYGMSDRLGTLSFGRRSRNPFLGRDYHEERNYSEEVAKMIDEEVRAIVDRCHLQAREIVETNRDRLDALAKALLERETLNREEFLAVMEGREMAPPTVPTDHGTPESTVDANKLKDNSASATRNPPRLEPGPA